MLASERITTQCRETELTHVADRRDRDDAGAVGRVEDSLRGLDATLDRLGAEFRTARSADAITRGAVFGTAVSFGPIARGTAVSFGPIARGAAVSLGPIARGKAVSFGPIARGAAVSFDAIARGAAACEIAGLIGGAMAGTVVSDAG